MPAPATFSLRRPRRWGRIPFIPRSNGRVGHSIGLSLDEPPHLCAASQTELVENGVYALQVGIAEAEPGNAYRIGDRTQYAERSRGAGPFACVERALASLRQEVHCHAIDAVAQMGRRRTVIEHVAEMAAAPRAMHLGADHAITLVGRCLDRALYRIVEARPPGAAVELAPGDEQLLAAAHALNVPARFSWLSAQLPGASVPCSRITSYCSAVEFGAIPHPCA